VNFSHPVMLRSMCSGPTGPALEQAGARSSKG
jgi:hypothetical protein